MLAFSRSCEEDKQNTKVGAGNRAPVGLVDFLSLIELVPEGKTTWDEKGSEASFGKIRKQVGAFLNALVTSFIFCHYKGSQCSIKQLSVYYSPLNANLMLIVVVCRTKHNLTLHFTSLGVCVFVRPQHTIILKHRFKFEKKTYVLNLLLNGHFCVLVLSQCALPFSKRVVSPS